jgi:hypothetical protein
MSSSTSTSTSTASTAQALQAPLASTLMNKNVNIYIPRMKLTYSEDDVKRIFAEQNMGFVNHVDFVSIKQQVTASGVKLDKSQFCHAFVKLAVWFKSEPMNVLSQENGSYQFWINSNEFWTLLPNTTPLERTRLNIHQVAAYTEEMQEKLDEQTKIIETQRAQLLKQQEQMDAQQKQINDILRALHGANTTTPTLTDSLDDSVCEKCCMSFDTPKQLHFHKTVCKSDSDIVRLVPKSPPGSPPASLNMRKRSTSPSESDTIQQKIREERSRILCGNA